MSKEKEPEAPAIVDPVVIIGGIPYRLEWDKSAMYRADEIGLYAMAKSSVGFARAVKYAWCMLPRAGRTRYPDPQDLASDLPPLVEIMPYINVALKKGGDATDPKKVIGSVSGHSS